MEHAHTSPTLLLESDGFQFGMRRVPHPSGHGDSGYALVMRKVGATDWEPETYGFCMSEDALLDRVATGHSCAAGAFQHGDIRHEGLRGRYEQVQAERVAREEAAARDAQEALERENAVAQREAAITEHMSGVRRKRGRAVIRLLNGADQEIRGWQHGDFLVHRRIEMLRLPNSARHGVDADEWSVTHVPSGWLVRHTHSAESGRELAYRMHLVGTGQWDGAPESLEPGSAFVALLIQPLQDFLDRNAIPVCESPRTGQSVAPSIERLLSDPNATHHDYNDAIRKLNASSEAASRKGDHARADALQRLKLAFVAGRDAVFERTIAQMRETSSALRGDVRVSESAPGSFVGELAVAAARRE